MCAVVRKLSAVRIGISRVPTSSTKAHPPPQQYNSSVTTHIRMMEKAGGGGGKKLTRGQATSFGFKRPLPAQQEPPKAVQHEQVTAYGFKKAAPVQQIGGLKKPLPKSEPAPPSFKKSTKEHDNQPPVMVQETIQPLLIGPVRPKTPAAAPVPKEKPVNRFGFRGPPLSNKVADVEVNKTPPLTSRSQSEPRKLRLETTHLPRGQCAIRAPTAAGYSAEADKRAKTAANNALTSATPSESSRTSKHEYDSVLEIQQLDHSPSMVNKFRQTKHQLRLQHEQNLQQQRQCQVIPLDQQSKSSECSIRSGAVAPVPGALPGRHPPLHRPLRSIDHMAFSSNEETGDEGGDETSTEEKLVRDKEDNEKDMLGCGESPTEEMWGRGEAMAIEEELCANFSTIDKTPETPPLRSVLLKIEDQTFAPLAALSSSQLLEDETLPESPDLSCSSPSSVEPLPPPPLSLSAKGSPGTPGTPTHGTNSLSGSDTRDRDFLIDDEIADQPGLVFDNRAGHKLACRKISKLVDDVSEALASVNPKMSGSVQSISTLSPCDSLTSDDLIADFDTSDISNFDELDEAALKSELQTQGGQVMREWNTLLSSHPGNYFLPRRRRKEVVNLHLSGLIIPSAFKGMAPSSEKTEKLKSSRRKPKLSGGSTSSGGGQRVDSPQSITSPVRTKRLGMTSPGDDGSDDSGIRVDRGTYQHMFQDVINIKSMLVRLQRILQEDGGGGGSEVCQEDEGEELADLRRQVVLLQAQLEERNRRVSRLEEELCSRRAPVDVSAAKTSSNKATQTDRIRPVSTSQTLFQSSPNNSTASFISCLSEKKERGGAGHRSIPRRTDAR